MTNHPWTIFHNPRCSKSRAALSMIEESGEAIRVVNYLQHPPTKAELEKALTLLGMEPNEIVRRGEAVFRELGLADRDLDRDQWLEILLEHPKLIERPIVIRGQRAVIGRPTERVRELL